MGSKIRDLLQASDLELVASGYWVRRKFPLCQLYPPDFEWSTQQNFVGYWLFETRNPSNFPYWKLTKFRPEQEDELIAEIVNYLLTAGEQNV